MKLIIMGAGYVGMELLRRFQSLQHEIYITTTTKERIKDLEAFGRQVLLLEPKDKENKELNRLIASCDGMIILVAPKTKQHFFEETYINTAKQVVAALKIREKPFYILYTSSISVCEGVPTDWVTEEMPLNPQSENAKLLLETERILLNSDADVCILRLGGIYGPGRELINRAKRFSGKRMESSGNEPTNHIHLEEIVAGILFCLNNSLKGIYNLVNDHHPTRKELYSKLCKLCELPPPLWDQENSVKSAKGYKVSNQKIKDAGFFFTSTTLEP